MPVHHWEMESQQTGDAQAAAKWAWKCLVDLANAFCAHHCNPFCSKDGLPPALLKEAEEHSEEAEGKRKVAWLTAEHDFHQALTYVPLPKGFGDECPACAVIRAFGQFPTIVDHSPVPPVKTVGVDGTDYWVAELEELDAGSVALPRSRSCPCLVFEFDLGDWSRIIDRRVRERALLRIAADDLPPVPPWKAPGLVPAIEKGKSVLVYLDGLVNGRDSERSPLHGTDSSDGAGWYLAVTVDKADALEGRDPGPRQFFYRAGYRELAEQLVELLSRALQASHCGPTRAPLFECISGATMDQADQFLTDEEISEIASEVSGYEAQWQVDCLELGEPPWVCDPYNPPLYQEDEPLSLASLYHRADRWATKLQPDSQPPGHESEDGEPGARPSGAGQVRAGQAFLEKLAEDPETRQAWLRVRARLRVLADLLRAVGPSDGQETLEEAVDSLDRSLCGLDGQTLQELQDEMRAAADEERRRWTEQYGEGEPEDLDDWKRMARRAGVSAERLLEGEWTLADIEPLIEGYLQNIRDQRQRGSTPAGVGAAEAQTPSGPLQALPAEAQRLRWLCQDMVKRLEDETDDGGFGNIDLRLKEAAELAASLGFQTPPICSMCYLVDHEVHNYTLDRKEEAPLAFLLAKHEIPHLLAVWFYRVYDPAGGDPVDIVKVGETRGDEATGRPVRDPWAAESKAESRRRIATILRRWVHAVGGMSAREASADDADEPNGPYRSASSDADVTGDRSLNQEPTQEVLSEEDCYCVAFTHEGRQRLDESGYRSLVEEAESYDIFADERTRAVRKKPAENDGTPDKLPATYFPMLRAAMEKVGHFDPVVDDPSDHRSAGSSKQVFQRARAAVDIKHEGPNGKTSYRLFKTVRPAYHAVYQFQPDADITYALIFLPSA